MTFPVNEIILWIKICFFAAWKRKPENNGNENWFWWYPPVVIDEHNRLRNETNLKVNSCLSFFFSYRAQFKAFGWINKLNHNFSPRWILFKSNVRGKAKNNIAMQTPSLLHLGQDNGSALMTACMGGYGSGMYINFPRKFFYQLFVLCPIFSNVWTA